MSEKYSSNTESSRELLHFLKSCGMAYKLKISNYTTEVISEAINTQMVSSMRGKQCFAAYAKVKSDISKKPVPEIDKASLKYFNHNFRNDFFAETVINIDLKSAYATSLLNSGMIRPETFKYLSGIPKLDRLAAVGMLASKKYLFEYDKNNKLISFEKIVSKYESFFYHCVKQIQDVMNELQFICMEDYLFTWVDGIYIKADSGNIIEVENFLNETGYPYTIEPLKNFRVKVHSGKISLSFEKYSEKQKAFKTKYFNIPATPSNLANDLVQYLLTTTKPQTNENLHLKNFH